MYKDRWINAHLIRSASVAITSWHQADSTGRSGYRRVDLSAARGRGRIWGTANPRYWASLDPGRPGKRQALVLDVGRFVRPFITPDDPDAVESAIQAQAHLERTSNGPAPIV
jgi:hypothetical protein